MKRLASKSLQFTLAGETDFDLLGDFGDHDLELATFSDYGLAEAETAKPSSALTLTVLAVAAIIIAGGFALMLGKHVEKS